MQITSIEVIRHNPGTEVVAGERVELTYGDTLKVDVSFDYRGSAQKVTLYGAIGSRGLLGFAEEVAGEEEIALPDSLEFTPQTASVNIPITSDIDPGTDYDLYVKILEYAKAGLPEVDDVIDIVGLPPVYELIQHTIYPYAYVYDGDVEVSTFTFKTAPFVPADWAAKKLVDAVQSEAEKEGGQVIELKVYADKTPLLWTDFRIEAIGTPLGGVGAPGIAVGIPIWAAILIAALAIALLIAVITWSIKTIVGTFTHKALSPEIKEPWSRETLISCIGDFEEKLERTPTPLEELGAMSDDELRDYCDQLAEEIVPPEVSWLPLAIVGGLGVLGIGAVAALAARRE